MPLTATVLNTVSAARRWHVRAIVVLVALMLGHEASGAAKEATQAPPRDQPCVVAETILRMWISHSKASEPRILTVGADKLTRATPDNRRWRQHQPSDAIIAKFGRTAPVDGPTTCPHLASVALEHGWKFDARAAETPWKGENGSVREFWPEDIQTMALPVIGDDGTEALIDTGSSCGMTCGSGWLIYCQRDKRGRWVVADSANTWNG